MRTMPFRVESVGSELNSVKIAEVGSDNISTGLPETYEARMSKSCGESTFHVKTLFSIPSPLNPKPSKETLPCSFPILHCLR